MSLRSLTSLDSSLVKTVRRARAPGRRRIPVERGAELLQLNSRITHEEARVLARAREILLRLSARPASAGLTSPHLVREYLKTLLAGQERELFVMVALDNRHRVIASEILFAGTIDGAPVYPREVVKCALRHNASAVIFAHFVAGHVMSLMHP